MKSIQKVIVSIDFGRKELPVGELIQGGKKKVADELLAILKNND